MDKSETDQSDPLSYCEIDESATAEIKVKGSRFIAHAEPAHSVNQSEQILADYQRRYHDATHVCYAFRVGTGDKMIYRYSDAGEPAGSAGAPILQVISGKKLTNLIVLVVRYFGGTKLGIGGLIRAYTEATKAVLEQVSISKKTLQQQFQIHCTYDFLNVVMRTISRFEADILKQTFADSIDLEISVPVNKSEAFRSELIQNTAGRVEIS